MQFALLIYGDEAAGNERYAGLSEEQAAATTGEARSGSACRSVRFVSIFASVT